MNVLIVNTHDGGGGAAIASRRILDSLKSTDIKSALLVRHLKYSQCTDIIPTLPSQFDAWALWSHRLDNIGLRFYPRRSLHPFSLSWMPSETPSVIQSINSDLVHLNWITGAFLRIEALPKIMKPIVWTMHDAWPFTGGCHITYDCQRFRESCGRCPVLGSTEDDDLSASGWNRKYKTYRKMKITGVVPSHWMQQLACQSSLMKDMRIEVIPNPLDTNFYFPLDKCQTRLELKLPINRPLILCSLTNSIIDLENKGDKRLIDVFQRLFHNHPDLNPLILTFGAVPPTDSPFNDPLRYYHFGRVIDEAILVKIYNASDVFITASKSESLSYTITESMSCGVPAVAYDVGGISDLIAHKMNGYLAKPMDNNDLLAGLLWVLEDSVRYKNLSSSARTHINEYCNSKSVGEKYARLYHEVYEASKR